jgi:pyruvate/2-oxoglutarate dehydrogenase complex dihydrolipoamide acyltransferase (E2) component
MKAVLKIVWLVGLLLSVGAAVVYYFANEAAKKNAQTAAARAARWRKPETEPEPEPETETETEPENLNDKTQ